MVVIFCFCIQANNECSRCGGTPFYAIDYHIKRVRRMKRKASVMWSSSSSSDDVNDEAEGTDRCKFKKREKGKVP